MAELIVLPTDPRFQDLTGLAFGRWTVLAYAGMVRCGKKARHQWLCRCECGKEQTAAGANLKSGISKSCGCLKIEGLSARTSSHRMSGSAEFRTWAQIKTRCCNIAVPAYKYYGGRGITVCERWLNSFENFYADMGPRPSPKHSIERVNNSLGYSPENCRWADVLEQAKNRRNNKMLTCNGHTQHLLEWSRETGIHYVTILSRLKSGVSVEVALSTPSLGRGSNKGKKIFNVP